MRVKFEYTIDDLIDVQMRLLKHSRAARSWRSRDLVTASLLSGGFLFAVVPAGITGRLIMGGIGLGLGALSFAALQERTVQKRLRKFYEEQAGPERLFCEVELNESGIHTSSNGMQTIFDWEKVKEIQETQDSVDFYTERGGILVVRNRAFTSTEERLQFIRLADEYLKRAEQTSPAAGAI